MHQQTGTLQEAEGVVHQQRLEIENAKQEFQGASEQVDRYHQQKLEYQEYAAALDAQLRNAAYASSSASVQVAKATSDSTRLEESLTQREGQLRATLHDNAELQATLKRFSDNLALKSGEVQGLQHQLQSRTSDTATIASMRQTLEEQKVEQAEQHQLSQELLQEQQIEAEKQRFLHQQQRVEQEKQIQALKEKVERMAIHNTSETCVAAPGTAGGNPWAGIPATKAVPQFPFPGYEGVRVYQSTVPATGEPASSAAGAAGRIPEEFKTHSPRGRNASPEPERKKTKEADYCKFDQLGSVTKFRQ